MIDSLGHAEMVARKPYLYHYAWNADDAKRDSILAHGLERVSGHYGGLWASRPGHVYLGDPRHIKGIFFPRGAGLEFPFDLFRVDVAQLEPGRINADEDHFLTGNFPDRSENRIGGKHACAFFRHPFPPTGWIWNWGKRLKLPVPSLGEWAEACNIGANPAETRYSVSKGSIAYAGVVPPGALELVKSHRPPCG